MLTKLVRGVDNQAPAFPLTQNEMADAPAKVKPKGLRWRVSASGTSPKKRVAWWGDVQAGLASLTDTVLPPSIYENLLEDLRRQLPFAKRDLPTNATARSVALLGGRSAAEKLANLSASNDPATLRLLSHFGHLSRWVKTGNNDAQSFTVEPFPEKGAQWAFDFFLRDMPIRPEPQHWRLAIQYYLNLEAQFPREYPILRLLDILHLPVSQGISISRSMFHSILNHIALASPAHRNIEKEATDFDLFLQNVHSRLKTMSTIISFMYSHFSYRYIHDEEVYLALFKACSQPLPTVSSLIQDINLPLPKHHRDDRRLLLTHYFQQHHNLPITPEFFLMDILLFAHLHKWRSFLKRWRWASEAGVAKDTEMWTVFWGCLARGQHEFFIRTALREMYHEMMDEGRYVGIGSGRGVLNKDIGIALGKCLELVDPHEREFEAQRNTARWLVGSSGSD
jgi:hypothetical protein